MKPTYTSSSDRRPTRAAEQFLELLARSLAKRWLQQQRAKDSSPSTTAPGQAPTPEAGSEDRSADGSHGT